VKRSSSNKWSCVVDMKSCEDSEMKAEEGEVKKQDLAANLKVPLENLDLSYSFGSHSSVMPEARHSQLSVGGDTDNAEPSSTRNSKDLSEEGLSHDKKVVSSRDHMTPSDSGCINHVTDDEGGSGSSTTNCQASMEDVGIHLAETAGSY